MAYGAKFYRMAAMRGDPGLFGSIAKFVGKVASPLSKVIGKVPIVGKIAPQLLRAVPGLGTVISLASIGGTVAKGIQTAKAAKVATTAMTLYSPSFAKVAGGMSMGTKLALGAGGAAAATAVGRGFLQPGTSSGRRRYRRMNVCNFRALTRAIRRVKRFEKLARSSITLSSHVRVKKGARGRRG